MLQRATDLIDVRDCVAVLPDCARGVSVRFAAGASFEAVQLPADLSGAIPKRKQQFLAGRYCAARAIRSLAGLAIAPVVGRGARGEPLWPHGLVGSVTHTGQFASAAVARRADVSGIGIDSEEIVTPDQAQRLSSAVLLPSELSIGGRTLDDALRFTLVFCAKEALFKCLCPVVHRRFYFHDAAVVALDLSGGALVVQLRTALSDGLPAGYRFAGRFALDGKHVHTGVWAPAPHSAT